MEFATPDTLYSKLVTIVDDGTSFILCHPRDDTGTDPDISILFRARSGTAEVLRVFDREIPSMTALADKIVLVDDDCGVYIFAAGDWSEWTDMDPKLARISNLRTVRSKVYGLCYDGIIYRWDEPNWTQVTDGIPKLYLHDLKGIGQNGLLASGSGGFLAEVVGRGFDRYDIPTNMNLTCILPLGGAQLLVTGWEGTALLGERDEMQFVDQGARDDITFAEAVRWQGRTLVTARDEILELKDNTMVVAWTTRNLGLVTYEEQLWKHSNEGAAYHSSGEWINVPLSVDMDL
ncbi:MULTISPECIES: hypothetical protein [unclassified Mesorhizobium]|uniref:hypothetical protein n=1 Tax=unclassified Mesorhizobium TaxID=325217 RepID=UPI0030154A49